MRMFLMLVIWRMLCLSSSVSAQVSVVVGKAEFQLNRQGSILCTINVPPGDIYSNYWRWSLPDATTAPHDNLIIQKTGMDVTVGPGYDGRVDITSMRSENSLVIYSVIEADLSLRYWCQANVRGQVVQDSVLPTLLDDPTASSETSTTSFLTDTTHTTGTASLTSINRSTAPSDTLSTGETTNPLPTQMSTKTGETTTTTPTKPGTTFHSTTSRTAEPTDSISSSQSTTHLLSTPVSKTSVEITPATPTEPVNLPGPISNLQVFDTSDVGDHQVTVIWNPGYSGGVGIKQWFVVTYSEIPQGNEAEVTLTVPDHWCELDGLKAGTVYEISVDSENRIGKSGQSKIIAHKTDEDENDVKLDDHTILILKLLGVGVMLLAALVFLILVFLVYLCILRAREKSDARACDVEIKSMVTASEQEVNENKV